MTTIRVLRFATLEGEAPMEARDEAALASSLLGGDRRAAEELAEATYREIFAVLCRLTGGDRDLAADLTQETYRRAWASLASFAGRAQFSTWLYRIAYTTFLNHVRRPRRVVQLDEEGAVERVVDDDPPPDEVLVQSADAERLRRAVIGLPDELRFTVTAHYWRRLPVAEIAALDRISTVAVRKRLKRAFKILALAMEEDTP